MTADNHSLASTTLAQCTQMDAQDPLRALRDQFALPEGVIYLDGNSLGVLPAAAPARVAQAVQQEWGEGLIRSWNTANWVNLPQRLLVRTYERMPIERFDDALSGIEPELIERLAGLGVVLVGIDSASIDPAASKTLDAHQAIRRRGLRVLENLVLDDVPEGDYELIALPLKFTTADASPVRAVLRSLT